jgi:menaquinone-dependent protoporphyrinogen IX oxidase
MRTVIGYESTYGNTRRIAEEIGRGLAGASSSTRTPGWSRASSVGPGRGARRWPGP